MKPLLTTLVCAALATCSYADGLAEAIRSVAAKNSPYMVEVKVVLKETIEGESMNSEVSSPGVVISPTGLIVTSSLALGGLMRDVQVNVANVTLRIGGQDVPGKIVLRDSNRNLTYVRPNSPLSGVAFLDVAKGASVQLGDYALVLSNLGPLGYQKPCVAPQRIIGVIEKPRLTYALAGAQGFVGCPAFDENGAFIGVVTVKYGSREGVGRSTNPFNSFLTTIIPAADIAESAAQAPEAKAVADEGSSKGKKP